MKGGLPFLPLCGKLRSLVLIGAPDGLRLLQLVLGRIACGLVRRFTLFDDPADRTIKKPAEKPDDDQEIDRLKSQCPPVDLHSQPTNGLA